MELLSLGWIAVKQTAQSYVKQNRLKIFLVLKIVVSNREKVIVVLMLYRYDLLSLKTIFCKSDLVSPEMKSGVKIGSKLLFFKKKLLDFYSSKFTRLFCFYMRKCFFFMFLAKKFFQHYYLI